ncbi:MAG TPA: hypothetical protein PK878_06505 [bacterium]|nr:hypothetical protein [bacterium]HOL96096.1 hypothetical protein [bacterium]HPO99488.1 hypothetical protein [bacterium]HXK92594.1 hypothetical protein [bacterium]
MNTPNIHTLREKLLLYVETVEWGRQELPEIERREIEECLRRDATLRREMEAIAAHLRFLRDSPPPRVPEDLATRCLETIQRRAAKRRRGGLMPWWAYATAFAVILIFAAGIWVGHQFPPAGEMPFQILLQEQHQLVARLESSLAGRYHETTLTTDNPWYQPLATLKETTRALAAYHEQTKDNLVIQRGLCIAIAQNITMLRTLCDYIEKNQSIPDYDMKFLNTASSAGNAL